MIKMREDETKGKHSEKDEAGQENVELPRLKKKKLTVMTKSVKSNIICWIHMYLDFHFTFCSQCQFRQFWKLRDDPFSKYELR